MNFRDQAPELNELFNTLETGSPGEEAAFAAGIQILKQDSHNFSGICPEGVFVKCYQPKGALGKWLSCIGQSRAHRTYSRAQTVAGVTTTPQPLALVRNKKSGNAYYFTALVPAKNLLDFYHQEKTNAPEIRELLARIGDTLANLHQGGWLHGDFKWSNILISTDKNPGKIWFIDLDATRQISPAARVRGRDLARFIVNAEDHHVEEEWVACFADRYSETSGMSVRDAIEMAGPYLKKLRRRHDRQYGLRTHSMFNQYNGSD